MHDKIIFDCFKDITNYDHSVPLIIMLIEYCINNVPFLWLHWVTIALVQYSYILFQWFYSVNIEHKLTYDFMDWYNHPLTAMGIGCSSLVISFVFVICLISINNCKVRAATGIDPSKDL